MVQMDLTEPLTQHLKKMQKKMTLKKEDHLLNKDDFKKEDNFKTKMN